MTAFKKVFSETPDYFDEYLTDEIIEDLEDQNPTLKTLTGDKLAALQCKVYYTHMNKTHPEVLKELRDSMR